MYVRNHRIMEYGYGIVPGSVHRFRDKRTMEPNLNKPDDNDGRRHDTLPAKWRASEINVSCNHYVCSRCAHTPKALNMYPEATEYFAYLAYKRTEFSGGIRSSLLQGQGGTCSMPHMHVRLSVYMVKVNVEKKPGQLLMQTQSMSRYMYVGWSNRLSYMYRDQIARIDRIWRLTNAVSCPSRS
uniref:Uncharacterized protein n=1 Tax=Pestalotiopsis fici TaxID=393283 RepID=A0A067XNV6_9PEZI|nr:hypothetical protein [Pestalotiopsis fici]